MAVTKYLDYTTFQYYHQKLKLETADWTMTNEEIESICADTIEASSGGTPVNKSLTIDYINISMSGAYAGSSTTIMTPVSWFGSRISIQSNTQYTFSNILTLTDVYYQDSWEMNLPLIDDINGLAIRMSCTEYDEDTEEYHTRTYSTIGKEYPGFSLSKYYAWEGYKDDLGRGNKIGTSNLLSDFWNCIDFAIPVGSYETFDLNYYLEDYDLYYDDGDVRLRGKYKPKSNFEITLIRNSPEIYSMSLYWRCVE